MSCASLETGKSIDEKVIQIKMEVQKIDAELNHLRKVRRAVWDESSEGGLLLGYYSGDTLKRLCLDLKGESGHSTSAFSFSNSNLISVVSVDANYNHPIGWGADMPGGNEEVKVVHADTQLYYIDESNILAWFVSSVYIPPSDSSYPERMKSILENVGEYTKRMEQEFPRMDSAIIADLSGMDSTQFIPFTIVSSWETDEEEASRIAVDRKYFSKVGMQSIVSTVRASMLNVSDCRVFVYDDSTVAVRLSEKQFPWSDAEKSLERQHLIGEYRKSSFGGTEEFITYWRPGEGEYRFLTILGK